MKITPPSEYRISLGNRLTLSQDDTLDSDGRGVVFLYEPPDPRGTYVMGIDAAQGRTGWTRYNRSDSDTDVDNGAIEVIRIGRGDPGSHNFVPDRQVAEFAAPIDPYDLARVGNILGRLYGGNHEDGQALCIVEVYPGPGGPTQRTMMERYGYTNFYRFQYLDTGEQTKRYDFGWYSTKQSMQHLWTRGLRSIHRQQVVFKSDYLVEELINCEMDLIRLRGQAAEGHDDRAIAFLLALWAGHNWTFNVEPVVSKVESGPVVDWQSLDISSERMQDAWEEKWAEISAQLDQSSA